MLTSLTLADSAGNDVVLHETDGRCIVAAQGLVGITAVRESKRPRPTAHGWISESKWTDGKTIQLAGECWGDSEEEALEEFRTIAAPMMQTLDDAPALLKWTEGVGGFQLQSLVKLASPVEPNIAEGASYGGLVLWDAVLESEDPRAYGQVETTLVSTALTAEGGGFTFAFTFPFTFTASGGGLVVID